MAKRSRRGGSPVRVIEKSLSDAQKVLASYISSGSDQITDTMRAVRRIFDNRQLAIALKKARNARMAVASAVGGSTAKKRKATSSRRKAKSRRTAARRSPAKRSTSAMRARRRK